MRLSPSSSKPGAAWTAEPVSPALDAGLLGHSAAAWGNRAFIFGGLQEFTSNTADDVARKHGSFLGVPADACCCVLACWLGTLAGPCCWQHALPPLYKLWHRPEAFSFNGCVCIRQSKTMRPHYLHYQAGTCMHRPECIVCVSETVLGMHHTASCCAAGTTTKRTVNMLRAYALDEAGTQGGLLPVLSNVPQLGSVPSSRMYHRYGQPACLPCELALADVVSIWCCHSCNSMSKRVSHHLTPNQQAASGCFCCSAVLQLTLKDASCMFMVVSRCKSKTTRECLLTASQDWCMHLTLQHTPGTHYAQQVRTLWSTVY